MKKSCKSPYHLVLSKPSLHGNPGFFANTMGQNHKWKILVNDVPNETITTAHTTNIMSIDCVAKMSVGHLGAGQCNMAKCAGFRDLQLFHIDHRPSITF